MGAAPPGPATTSLWGRSVPLIWISLTVVYGTALFLASGIPIVGELERAGGDSKIAWDKVLHFLAFLILGLLMIQTFRAAGRGRRVSGSTWTPLLAALVYAGVHEGVQWWLPGFTFNLLDLLADAFGVLTAGVLGRLLISSRPATAG